MAHPYLVIEVNGSGTLDLKPYFAGFFGQNGKSVTPTFSLDTDMATGLYAPSIDGTTLTVKATKPGSFNVTVNDGETTFTQRFGVVITGGEQTAIRPAWSENGLNVVKREFFTLDGRQVSTLQSHEVYLMKVTDSEGRVHSVKILAN